MINANNIDQSSEETVMDANIKDVISAMRDGKITGHDLIGSEMINVSAGRGRVTRIVDGVFHIYFGGIDKLSRKVNAEALLDTRKWKSVRISDEIYFRMKSDT